MWAALATLLVPSRLRKEYVMKKLLLIVATLLVLAVSGCAPQVDEEADAAAVRNVFDEATAALNPGGGDIVDLDTEDAVVMYANGPAAIGKEAIRTRQQGFADQVTFEESRSVEEVVASGDWAFVRWTGTGTVIPKDGGESSEFDRKGITIFQRQADKSWKIARVIWNSENPISSAATSASPLEGAWVVTSLQSSEGEAIDPAGPGQFIFLGGRYSAVYTVGVTERRKSEKAFDPTEEEMVEQYDTIIVNSGTYQVEGNELTLRPLVAKSPEYIGGSSTMEFSVDGDTLTTKIRQLTSVNGISPEGAIDSTMTLRRVP